MSSVILPVDTAVYRKEKERLAEELRKEGFTQTGDGVLARDPIHVEFHDMLSVSIHLASNMWYGAFEMYYKDATAKAIINIAKAYKENGAERCQD